MRLPVIISEVFPAPSDLQANLGSASVSQFQQFNIEDMRLSTSLACMESMPSFRAEGQENPKKRKSVTGDQNPRKRKSVREDEEPFNGPSPSLSPRQPFGETQEENLSGSSPHLKWTEELWRALDARAEMYPRSLNLDAHPDIKPGTRAVVLSWMTEVSQMFKLHRETYHTAVEYTDRYLLKNNNVQPDVLKLIGVTALFMAAKVEETDQPRSDQFLDAFGKVYGTDVLLECERIMLQVLERKLYPMTPNTWIQLFLQTRCFIEHVARKQTSHHQEEYDFDDPGPLVNEAVCSLQHEAANDFESDGAITDLTYSKVGGCEIGHQEESEISGVEVHERSEVNEIGVVEITEGSPVGDQEPIIFFPADGADITLEIEVGNSEVNSKLLTEVKLGDSGNDFQMSEEPSESEVEEHDQHDADLTEADQSLRDEELLNEDADITVPQNSTYDYLQVSRVLERKLYPVTPNTWIQLFLQTRCFIEHVARKQTSHHQEEYDFDDPGPLVNEAVCSLQHEAANDFESDGAITDLTYSKVGGCEIGHQEESEISGVEVHERSEVNEIGVVEITEGSPVGDQEPIIFFPADGADIALEIEVGNSEVNSKLLTEVKLGDSGDDFQMSEEPSESEVEEHDQHDADLTEADQSLRDEELLNEDADITVPQNSTYDYLQVSRLIDSAVLDLKNQFFSSKSIAAAALFLATAMNVNQIRAVTGMTFPEIERCVYWLKMHQMVIGKHDPRDVCLKLFEDIKVTDCHKIQYNSITQEMWVETLTETEKFWDIQSKLDKVRMDEQTFCPPS